MENKDSFALYWGPWLEKINKKYSFWVCKDTHDFIFWVVTRQWQYKLNWINNNFEALCIHSFLNSEWLTRVLHLSEPSCPHQNATSAFDRNFMHPLTKCMQTDKQPSYLIWAILFILIGGRMNFIHSGPNSTKKAISVTNCGNGEGTEPWRGAKWFRFSGHVNSPSSLLTLGSRRG